MKIHALWLSASVLALGWGGLAQAQTAAAPAGRPPAAQPNTVEELVITAERREENLQKTAIAATVLTGADLAEKGVFTVDQLQFISPSLTVNNFGQGNDFNIRGIGKGEHNTQTSTGVITYRDGVGTFPGYIQEEPYYDIADVEVLRGPQGTFSGQNATGGAVIVNTNDPKIGGGYDGYWLAHYGNYNDTLLQGAVNLPINDKLAARIAFNAQYRDTFYDISGPWKGDPNLYWGSARFSLLWKPTDDLSVLWKTDYDYLANGGYFGDSITKQSTNDLFTFANNWKTFATDQQVRTVLKAYYVEPSSGVTLRSISSYQMGRSAWTGDIDGTAAAAPNYEIDEAVNARMWTQEFNAISPSKGPLTWVAGLYYQNLRYDFPYGRFNIGVPPGAVDENLNGVNNTYTAAAFGQVSYDLPDGFQLQVGARYSKWSTTNRVDYYVPEFIAFGYFFHQNETETGSNVTGKVTLNWNLNDNNFLYAFVASGAKPGGLNTALYFSTPPGIIPPPFQQEYVTDYELGWKASFFEHHLNTQLGVFYNDFKHFQVIVPIPNNPLQSTEQNNPNPSKLYGLEATAQAVFGDLSFDAGIGLTHSEVGTFFTEDPRVGTSAAPCNVQTGPATALCINLGGHPQTYAPELTFNVSARYNYHLAGGDLMTPSLSYSHIGSQWGTLFDNRAAGDFLEARDIVNAALAWTHGPYVATAYVYNLTNDHYVGALLSPIRIAGPPRQFGVSLMKVF